MKFGGIDFANRDLNVGRCILEVDDVTKSITPNLDNVLDMSGLDGISVDCPFGTSAGFKSLLDGLVPPACVFDAGLKTRATENWLRNTLWDYRTNQYWRDLPETTPQHYVNKTAHVQSAVGLVIVPAFLHWFLSAPDRSHQELVNARLGEYRIVESHPRPFLYSAIERIYRHAKRPSVNWRQMLQDVVSYKDKRRVSRVAERRRIYEFLQSTAKLWLWDDYQLANADERLFESDHRFDAFLAAMTSFAHVSQQTITWTAAATTDANLSEKVVE